MTRQAFRQPGPTLRRTFATRLHQQGASLKLITVILGARRGRGDPPSQAAVATLPLLRGRMSRTATAGHGGIRRSGLLPNDFAGLAVAQFETAGQLRSETWLFAASGRARLSVSQPPQECHILPSLFELRANYRCSVSWIYKALEIGNTISYRGIDHDSLR